MTGRKLWVVPLIWLLTVAGASALTWSVISVAGTRVGQPIAVATSTGTDNAVPETSLAADTWTGRGGRLTASCSGDSVSLVTAVPDVGYWVKVYDPGPEALRVDFESTDPDDHSEVRLRATCERGSPVFARS